MNTRVKGKQSRASYTDTEKQAIASIDAFYMGFRAMQQAEYASNILFDAVSLLTKRSGTAILPKSPERRREESKNAVNAFAVRHFGREHPYEFDFSDEPVDHAGFPEDVIQWLHHSPPSVELSKTKKPSRARRKTKTV